MTSASTALALDAAPAPLSPASRSGPGCADALFLAGTALLAHLEAGRAIDAAMLRRAMVDAFGATDAEGAWGWKDAYEAGEVAQVLFLRKFGPAMRTRPPAAQLAMLAKVSRLLPNHTRRSEKAQALQQFSTPMPLGLAAATAAAIIPGDVVLEPSAGTGLLAVFAELAGAALVLNELGDTRADLLSRLFPDTSVTRFDAARIHDHLDAAIRPSVVLMNPPFSVGAHVDGRVADAAYRHIASALARVAEGGRLVAITGAGFSPDNPAWDRGFRRLEERGRIVFSAALDGSAYARHGTTVETRLTVIDRVPAGPDGARPASRGLAPDVATLLSWVGQDVPCRPDMPDQRLSASPALRVGGSAPRRAARPQPRSLAPVAADAVELAYLPVAPEPTVGGRISESLYEPFSLQSVRIPDAQPHPTPLVQSAAMASVRPPAPSYRPHLPAGRSKPASCPTRSSRR